MHFGIYVNGDSKATNVCTSCNNWNKQELKIFSELKRFNWSTYLKPTMLLTSEVKSKLWSVCFSIDRTKFIGLSSDSLGQFVTVVLGG